MQEALDEVFGATATPYYEISHNLVQEETIVLPDGSTTRGRRVVGDHDFSARQLEQPAPAAHQALQQRPVEIAVAHQDLGVVERRFGEPVIGFQADRRLDDPRRDRVEHAGRSIHFAYRERELVAARGGFDAQGNPWFGGRGGALLKLDVKARQIREYFPPTPYVNFYEAMHDKLVPQLSAGKGQSAYDLIQVDVPWTKEFADAGWMAYQ